nr:unnamed protein product [Haemonchus contortus]
MVRTGRMCDAIVRLPDAKDTPSFIAKLSIATKPSIGLLRGTVRLVQLPTVLDLEDHATQRLLREPKSRQEAHRQESSSKYAKNDRGFQDLAAIPQEVGTGPPWALSTRSEDGYTKKKKAVRLSLCRAMLAHTTAEEHLVTVFAVE